MCCVPALALERKEPRAASCRLDGFQKCSDLPDPAWTPLVGRGVLAANRLLFHADGFVGASQTVPWW